jgi:L-amino acid N-acyltransferase
MAGVNSENRGGGWRIRPAREADLGAINDIYNYFVLHSACTYQEEPETIGARKAWFARHDERHPITVAEIDGRVVGWGSLSAFHARSAYRFTVENSVYVDHEFQGRGIGSAVLRDLIERGRGIGHHAIVALIDAEQKGSVTMHARAGFKEVGRLGEVGLKFGKWLDVVYMELML